MPLDKFNPQAPPLRAEHVSFHYREEPVLQDIGFQVDPGEYVILAGSNGTGKSTLLKLLLGELTPQSGNIFLWGEDSAHFRDWPRIGYVPQNGGSRISGFPATVEEIVLAGLYHKIGRFRPARAAHREQARDALAQVGMADLASRKIGELSGGQVQRVLIARVLAAGCALLLLDEPTAGVDHHGARSLYALLEGLNREKNIPVFMVSHDLERAAPYAHRILHLSREGLREERGGG